MTLYVGTSWKMHKRLGEALDWTDAVRRVAAPAGVQRFVIPPFTALREVAVALDGTDVMVGAQTMHWADEGAWTGEVSAPMLVDCGAQLVEIGHSERRTHFGETDETVGLKVAAALRHGLVPLVCLGETRDARDAGQADAVLAAQTRAALAPVARAPGGTIWLAYEPVWAIGAGGEPASAGYADARQARILDVAQEVLGRRVPCLYGGSVNAVNCAELAAQPHIDGLFIGRAAWDAAGYLDIVAKAGRVA